MLFRSPVTPVGPAQQVSYSVTWTTNIEPNDVITLSYDGLGDHTYVDGDGLTQPVEATSVRLVNCRNVAPTQNGTPTTAPISDVELTAITPFDGTVGFDAGNGLNPTYSISGAPAGIVIDPDTGEISGTLTQNLGADTNYNTTVSLSSSSGSASAPSFVWTITNALPVTTNNWATESGGVWNTETGDNWILEA